MAIKKNLLDEKELGSELEREEESKLKKILRKIFITVITFFLLFLVLIYFVPGGHILRIIEGRIISSTLDENFNIQLVSNGSVIFDQDVYTELKDIYFSEQRNEFKVCLIGEKIGKDYYVYDLEIPETYSKSFASVAAAMCDKDTIISLHSHPYKSCIFSEQDIKSYVAFNKINNDGIIGLMCEPDRFTFYGFS